MESATTLATILAGLLLSISCAVLLEELTFGGLFRIFFASRLVQSKQIQLEPENNR